MSSWDRKADCLPCRMNLIPTHPTQESPKSSGIGVGGGECALCLRSADLRTERSGSERPGTGFLLFTDTFTECVFIPLLLSETRRVSGPGVGWASWSVLSRPWGDTQGSGALAGPPMDPGLVGFSPQPQETGDGGNPTPPSWNLKASVAPGAGL